MALDFGEQRKGVTGRYLLTLHDSAGIVVDLTTATAVAAVLAPGSGLPSVATLTVAAQTPLTAGKVLVTVDDAVTLTVAAGQYQLFVTATAGGEPLAAPTVATLTLVDGPGTALAPTPGWTRAKVERSIVRRLRASLLAADLEIGGVGGNACLAEPILTALSFFDFAVVDPSEPSDIDFAPLSNAQGRGVVDVALYETMLSIQMGFIQVGWAYGSIRQDLGQFGERLQKQADVLAKSLLNAYGYGAAVLRAGTIATNNDPRCGDEFGGW